ncbi:hypothetical protein COX86_01265 [Candidatus Micrarchaeota archaeon CG_4_10_14_0_2_um_filter_60_11]|nr:MAG: hypothetical protein COX86_01265 [Candidatus Micrarchaeota archaeon CG_4_10_14_0_2_um_filter_60_11]
MSEDDDSSGGSSGGEYGGSGYGASREMHKTVCSDCGQECEVPFKPAEGRPVYCRECFKKHRRPTGGGYGGGRGGGSYGGYGGGRGRY